MGYELAQVDLQLWELLIEEWWNWIICKKSYKQHQISQNLLNRVPYCTSLL